MAQVTLNLPSLPKDWHSTLVGILGAIGMLVDNYTRTGTVTYEQIALAVLVAVICWFIPAKPSVADQAAMVATVTGVVNSALGDKLPSILAQAQKVPDLVETGIQAAVQVSQDQAIPAAPVPGS